MPIDKKSWARYLNKIRDPSDNPLVPYELPDVPFYGKKARLADVRKVILDQQKIIRKYEKRITTIDETFEVIRDYYRDLIKHTRLRVEYLVSKKARNLIRARSERMKENIGRFWHLQRHVKAQVYAVSGYPIIHNYAKETGLTLDQITTIILIHLKGTVSRKALEKMVHSPSSFLHSIWHLRADGYVINQRGAYTLTLKGQELMKNFDIYWKKHNKAINGKTYTRKPKPGTDSIS